MPVVLDCTVCHDDECTEGEFDTGEILILLPRDLQAHGGLCGHNIHRRCYVRTQLDNPQLRSTCPLCKILVDSFTCRFLVRDFVADENPGNGEHEVVAVEVPAHDDHQDQHDEHQEQDEEDGEQEEDGNENEEDPLAQHHSGAESEHANGDAESSSSEGEAASDSEADDAFITAENATYRALRTQDEKFAFERKKACEFLLESINYARNPTGAKTWKPLQLRTPQLELSNKKCWA